MRCVETSFMGSEATSVTPPPSPPKGREVIHLVTMTDTLASISVRYGVTVSKLQIHNGFRPGDQLWARREIRIPLPDQHSGNDTDEGCESGSTSEECALDGSKVATKTRRKSKASRSKSAPEKSPPQATTAKESDGTSITPSQSPPVSASFIVPPAIEVVEYNKPVVHSEDCVGFLDLFDKAYGRKAEPAVVKSKSALDFLSQFDKKYTAIKADAVGRAERTESHRNRTSLLPRGSVDQSVEDPSVLLVRQGTMQTYEGKRQAQDRALDAVQRILTSDFDTVAEEPVRETSRRTVDNELEHDLQFFDL